VIFTNQLPESSGIALLHALNAGKIANGDLLHLAFFGVSLEAIAITAAHVRHVYAEHPDQAIALARRDIASVPKMRRTSSWSSGNPPP